MNLLDRNAVRATATCDDTKPPCFASVMPASPQTMISLAANYAAGITLPRKTALHYCRAVTQNILWCRDACYRAVFLDCTLEGICLLSDKLYLANQTYKYFRGDISTSIHPDLIKILPLSHKM